MTNKRTHAKQLPKTQLRFAGLLSATASSGLLRHVCLRARSAHAPDSAVPVCVPPAVPTAPRVAAALVQTAAVLLARLLAPAAPVAERVQVLERVPVRAAGALVLAGRVVVVDVEADEGVIVRLGGVVRAAASTVAGAEISKSDVFRNC